MFKTIFATLLYLDILLAALSLVFACIIFRRGRNPVYFNFGMAMLFLSVWITDIVLAFFSIFPSLLSLLLALSFVFGLWILHHLFLFSLHFPTTYNGPRITIPLAYVLTIAISLTTLIPGLYVIEARQQFPFVYFTANPIGLTIFNAYFFTITSLAYLNLIRKYLVSDGIIKIQLQKILLGTSLPVMANIIFALMIYYFSNFDTTPIGIVFISLVIFYLYSILFPKRVI